MRAEIAKGFLDAHNKMKQERARFSVFLLTFMGIVAILTVIFAK